MADERKFSDSVRPLVHDLDDALLALDAPRKVIALLWAHGASQREVARKTRTAHLENVRRTLRGEGNPDHEVLDAIGEICGIPAAAVQAALFPPAQVAAP